METRQSPGFDEQVRLLDRTSGRPLVGFPYRFRHGDDKPVIGWTDQDGCTLRIRTPAATQLQLEQCVGEADGW